MQLSTIILLQQKEKIIRAARLPHTWNRVVGELLIVAVIGLALFGVVMGLAVPTWQHIGTIAWKIVALLVGALVLCTPALFVFSSIRGARLRITELVYFLVVMLATISIVVLALAPITAFFTLTTDNGMFLRMMNGVAIGLGLIFGVHILERGFLFIHEQEKEHDPSSATARDVLLLWLMLYVMVIAQLSIKLGPWYQ